MRDGTPVRARPLSAGDRAALAEAYRRLSPEARYHRFWTRVGDIIGERMLDRLLDRSGDRHDIWAVLDPTRPFPGLGAASWWREADDPDCAEVSVTVLDADQGRGIGTLLLAIMWLTAYRAGIRRLVAYGMMENRRAARWMSACGGNGRWDGYKLTFSWELENLEALPETEVAAELADWLARLAPTVLEGK